MLKETGIYFEGDATALLTSEDPYLKQFLTGWVPPLGAFGIAANLPTA